MTEASKAITLATPVSDLSGIGSRCAKGLIKLGIESVSDLLRHLPMRYERHAAESGIAELQPDTIGTARGTLAVVRWVGGPGRGGKRQSRLEATLQDDDATLRLVWFNAGYLRDKLHPGVTLRVRGKVASFANYLQIVNPKWELLDEEEQVAQTPDYLRPIYPATEQLSSIVLEELIRDILPKVTDQLTDPLPQEMLEHHAMPTLAKAMQQVHQPADDEEPAVGRRRLAFNEFLLLQLGIVLKRQYNEHQLKSPVLRFSQAMDGHIRKRIGFELTESQSQVVGQIVEDLQKTVPMNRLLQGDVGSGKTAVALYALLMAVADGYQGALMAPTELLAEQHFLSIGKMLEGSNVRLALLTAGQAGTAGSAQRKALLAQIQAGEVDIVIGTQALVSTEIQFHKLALAVVDEQHRFGVLQRAAFRGNVNGSDTTTSSDALISAPHCLVMTATPIPRTLSLTVFGDLDISTIYGLPPGRKPIVTRVVSSTQSDAVYQYLRGRLDQGEQAYVVVPAIDENNQGASAKQLKSVTAHAKMLEERFFSKHKVATLHGRLKSKTRESVMNKFREGKIQVLVATTVIEVGVDVPNATVMVVEHAERFGLAQLHQLRGRIGRGTKNVKNLCVFISDPTTEQAAQRMEAIGETLDGFQIAEADLEIRGMGDFFGTRQHGMPPLRVARIPQDMDLLQLARRDAATMVAKDRWLSTPKYQRLRNILIRQYGDDLPLIDVG